ncbi:putative RNA exonuclease pqe-1 [Oppia nitens]|uniref:putative RNA exonuclease pqe-1 n=1 Tax=Oppia nitens TaxID=1686743 RepID=UPI0023DC03B7|nr:putative RNA exonuclease pqe-1 [Oppia nitens]
MLPTSGYFRDITCPYLRMGLCERGHCHYRHDQRYEVAAKTKPPPPRIGSGCGGGGSHSSIIPDYVPTPVAKLKLTYSTYSSVQPTTDLMTTTTTSTTTTATTSVTEKLSKKTSSKFKNIYENIPEYKPTPISQLKRQNVGKQYGDSEPQFSDSDDDANDDNGVSDAVVVVKKPKIKSSVSSSDESVISQRSSKTSSKTSDTNSKSDGGKQLRNNNITDNSIKTIKDKTNNSSHNNNNNKVNSKTKSSTKSKSIDSKNGDKISDNNNKVKTTKTKTSCVDNHNIYDFDDNDDDDYDSNDDLISSLNKISGQNTSNSNNNIKRKKSFDDLLSSADGNTTSSTSSISANNDNKKIRIAHQSSHQMTSTSLANRPKKGLRLTPAQVMQQRFAIQANKKTLSTSSSYSSSSSTTSLSSLSSTTTTTTTSDSNTTTTTSTVKSKLNASTTVGGKTRVAHRPVTTTNNKVMAKSETTSSTVAASPGGGGKKRIAHTPSTAKRPMIIGGVGNKIPAKLRQLYLNKFIDEYLVYLAEEEAFKRGLLSEKMLYDRSKSESIYKVLSVHEVKKIRNEAQLSQPTTGTGNKLMTTTADNKKLGNTLVSHEAILNGKITGTFSVERRPKSLTADDLTDLELYRMLEPYVLSEQSLADYGYPRQNPDKRGSAILPKITTKILNNYSTQMRTCARCQKMYTVQDDDDEMPSRRETCIYHWGRLWNERFNRAIERKYSCCKLDAGSSGCTSNAYHIVDGFDRPDYCDGYVRTLPLKPPPQSNYYGIYGLDCEMCYTTHGLELTRVTIVNAKQQTIYESLVKPTNPILDYNSKFSGIKESDLRNVTTRLTDVQRRLQSLFNDKTILIGHSLDSDLKALKLIHHTVVDTAQVFPHKRGLPFKRALRTLTAEFLHKIIQDDVDGHDSKEDATAALKLMLWKVAEDLKRYKR